jgi:hypothetical protein
VAKYAGFAQLKTRAFMGTPARRSSIRGGDVSHLIYATKKPLWIKGKKERQKS